MTTLERAARALCELVGNPRKAGDVTPSMRMPASEPDWEKFIPQARAVLQAIREPSEGMIEAGASGGDWPHSRETWQAMIDAALEEG